jgi:hypothetical protein
MSPAQTALYFREWGLARTWYIVHGLDPKQADAKRHELHVAALGRAKSSKAFTNADLDKVLAKFRAVHDGGNLEAQLAAEDAPEEQRREVLHRCGGALWDCYQLGDRRFGSEATCQSYIAGTCRNVIGKEPADCNAAELAKVLGCLNAMLRRARAKAPEIAAKLDAERKRKASESPF